jgi:hypothetical protein
MLINRRLYIILALLCCCTVSAWAQTDPNNWVKLNLSSTTIAGAKVYYDKSFEPNIPFFEKMYKEFLAAKGQNEAFNSKKNQIFADINSILGVSDPNTALQDRIWKGIFGAFSSIDNMTFYLVKQNTTKDFLRAGGQLPNFTYDKANDQVRYNPQITGSSKGGPAKNFKFAFPIASEQTFETDVANLFQILRYGFGSTLDTAIHEIVEMILLMRTKPTDPYWRWFSDGVANTVTYELLKKHAGTQFADDFIKDYDNDVNNYEALKKELNLRYWLTGRSCILIGDMPIEAEKRLNYARYAYATLEARRLVDKYGIDCVRKILNEVSARQSRTGDELIETIKNVTGDDMNIHLAAYQSFEQRLEGITKYATAFNDAQGKKDSEQMLFNLFRLHELRLPSEAEQLMYDYRYSAMLLFKMGFEQQADTVMENCIAFFSNPSYTNGRLAASESFILYALECKKPLKATKAADEILKTAPNNVLSLTIKMFVHLEDKQLNQAKELAQKIIGLSKSKESISYQIASAVLAIDPNQPRPAQ